MAQLSGFRALSRSCRLLAAHDALIQSSKAPFLAAQKIQQQHAFSTTSSRRAEESQAPPKHAKPRRGRISAVGTTAAVIGVLAASGWWILSSKAEELGLSTERFTPFTITAREDLSPSAFILTVKCPEGRESAVLPQIREAWEHGLWSVEVKQPQVQIARHYTPLPPRNGSAAGVADTELRFLIRRLEGGEMSNYISRLQIGDALQIRGPHLGFDVRRRLGDAKQVVFLAAGTGIAPALQIAHRLFEGPEPAQQKPELRLLWANRKSVDAVGRTPVKASDTSLAEDIEAMRGKYAPLLDIQFFVDDEKKFISAKDVSTALSGLTAKDRAPTRLATDSKKCAWHLAPALALQTEEDDTRSLSTLPCTCTSASPEEGHGRNLIFVSGPDGFIRAYAGSKRWHEGKELQGTVQGLLGAMKKKSPGQLDDWLVLKL